MISLLSVSAFPLCEPVGLRPSPLTIMRRSYCEAQTQGFDYPIEHIHQQRTIEVIFSHAYQLVQ